MTIHDDYTLTKYFSIHNGTFLRQHILVRSKKAMISAVLEVYGPFPSESRNERPKQRNLELYKRRIAARFTVGA